MALAITATVPLADCCAAANQAVEMPDGRKYTDTNVVNGGIAIAGAKVTVHCTGWLRKDGAKGPASTARSTAASLYPRRAPAHRRMG